MAATGGFIQLHRKIVEWEWYQNTNTFRLFLHCLLMANFTDGRFEGKEVKRGQFVTSLDHLSKQTRLSVRQVRVALDHLIMTGELTSQSFNRFRIITVVKYDVYQNEGKQNGKQTASEGQAEGKQGASKGQQYNNDNKGIMEKGNNNISCLFDEFWSAYPRKEAKAKAKAVFEKIKPDEELLRKMLDAIEKWKKTGQWQEEGGRFIPHPSTWLNQKRWEDEVPAHVPTGQKKILPAQNFQQRDYSGVTEEMLKQQSDEIIQKYKDIGAWDYEKNCVDEAKAKAFEEQEREQKRLKAEADEVVRKAEREKQERKKKEAEDKAKAFRVCANCAEARDCAKKRFYENTTGCTSFRSLIGG